jgi:hypothetical protein
MGTKEGSSSLEHFLFFNFAETPFFLSFGAGTGIFFPKQLKTFETFTN